MSQILIIIQKFCQKLLELILLTHHTFQLPKLVIFMMKTDGTTFF